MDSGRDGESASSNHSGKVKFSNLTIIEIAMTHVYIIRQ